MTTGDREPRRLTAIVLQYRKNRLNHRLLFGTPAFRVRRGWRRELAVFAPEQSFGYERWRGDGYGTQGWRLFVCRTVANGPLTRIPGVMPGAVLLLDARGKSQVKRALAAIDALKSETGTLENVPPHRWRALHNTLQTRRLDDENGRPL